MDFDDDGFTLTEDGISETEESRTSEDTVYLPPLNQPDEV